MKKLALICSTIFFPLLMGFTDAQKDVWKSVETYNELSANRDPNFIIFFDDSYLGWDYTVGAPQKKETIKTIFKSTKS